MSIPKANAYLLAAAAALGVSLTAGRPAVAETMLDQFTVRQMGIVQVNDAGQCVVIVTVNSGAAGADEIRVVGDFGGNAKLYTNFGAADGIIKSSKIEATTDFKIKRKLPDVALSDPISTLVKMHKAFKAEGVKAAASKVAKEAEISASVVLGWDTMAADTAEKKEHVQMLLQLGTITETKTNADTRLAALTTALTNAGINPVTYLPIV